MSENPQTVRFLREPSLLDIEKLCVAITDKQDIIVSGTPLNRTMKLSFVAAAAPKSEREMLRFKTLLDTDAPVKGQIVGIEASELSSRGEFRVVVLPPKNANIVDLVTMTAEQMERMQHMGLSRIKSSDGGINMELSGRQWAVNDFE